MADINIDKFRTTVVREGSRPASAGFVESEGQDPVDPAGSPQDHLPVTIAASANALSITTSQVLSGAGTVAQYIRGDGSLADFPESSGGGSSVSYYLNGSVDQGTIGGVAYKELSKVPILGAGTDFSINADGYIASFITDAGDPSLLEIPGGNWNFETYFSASSSGGTPTFYVELYKVSSGGTATLIASSSSSPELIAFGTNLNPYFSTLAVPTTTLALTDRLAVRYYVTHSGRTITLHTENNHLCQIITTFTTGLTALNGLTAQVQNFAVGTTGTDFNIASATATHTFNLPTASATNRGALSSADWFLFTQAYNDKINSAAVTGTTTKTLTLTQQDGGTITASWSDLNTDAVLSVFGRTGAVVAANGDYTTAQVTESGNLYYTDARVNANANVAANTAARHNAVTLGTANGLSLSTQVLSLGLASAGVTGALSGSDWSTFNSKQNALTLTTTGTSGAATLVGATLNIPQYQAAGTYVTSVTASSPLASSGGTTPNITIQQASGSQSGFLSSTDWTTFNNKQNALTNPVTGTGTTNYLPKFTGSTTIGNSSITDTGSLVTFTTLLRQEGQYIQIANSTNPSLYINNNVVQWQNYVKSNYNLAFSDAVRDVLTLGYNGSPSFFQGCNLLVGTTIDNGARLQVSGGNVTVTNSGNVLTTIRSTSNTGVAIIYTQNDINNSCELGTWGSARAGFGAIQPNNGYIYAVSDLAIGSPTNLKFSTGASNSTRLTIDSLGAATFSSSVTANGTMSLNNDGTYGSTYKTLGFTGNSNGSHRIFAGTADDMYFAAATARGFQFWTNGSTTTQMMITAGGNVGIGTASPTNGLLVINSTAANGVRFALESSGTMNGIVALGSNAISGLATTDLALWTRGVMAFETGASGEKMRITSGGNLLVGTTTDNGARLQVSGTGLFSNTTSGSANNVLVVRNAASTVVNTEARLFLSTVAGDNRGAYISSIITSASNDNDLVFATNSAGSAPTEKLRISSTGAATFSSTINSGYIQTNAVGGAGNQEGLRIVNNNAYLSFFNSANTIRSAYIQGNTTDLTLNTSLAIPILFGTSNVTKMTLFDTGNLLVGTGSDNGARLQVNGGATLNGNLRIIASNGFNDSINLDRTYSNAMILNSSGNLILNGTTGSSRLTCYGDGYFSGGILTGPPYGTTARTWFLGRFITTTASTNGSIRVQIGTNYYNIPAEDLGIVPT